MPIAIPDYNYLSADTTKDPTEMARNYTSLQRQQLELTQDQAKQRWSDILAANTGPDGTINYQAARAQGAQDPLGRHGMMAGTTATSPLITDQNSQASAHFGLLAQQLTGLYGDPSDENLEQARFRLNRAGLPNVDQEIDNLKARPLAERQAIIKQYAIDNLDAAGRVGRVLPGRETVTAGNATYNYQTPPLDSPNTVTTQHGPPPGSVTPSFEPYDDQGQIPRDANGNPSRAPKFWQPSTVPVTAVPGVPTGGPPVTTRPDGSAVPTDQAGRPLASPLLNPKAPPGTPPGRNAPVTPPASPAGNAPQTATSASAAPAAVTASPPATLPAAVPAVKPPVVTAPPQMQPEKLKADVEQYTRDQTAYPDVQTRAQNMAHAYNALQQLKSATGQGAAGINQLRSYAQTLGVANAGAVKEQELFELVTKYTEREMINAAGGSTTDMGRRMQEQANAGTLLSTPANLEILRNDMGIKLQTMAAYKDHKDTSGNGYLEGRAKLADTTDPRGFVWNLYSPEEQARINKEVGEKGPAADKLHRAIGMAGRLNLQIPGLVTPPQKQSMAVPSQPSGNLLAMAGTAPGNALAAA